MRDGGPRVLDRARLKYGFDRLLFWEFAFNFDFKVRFSFATGDHGDSAFGANFEFEF